MKKLSQKEVGKRIRIIRNAKNLDQKEFADKIETTVSSLSNWENGRNYPKPVYIERICEIFGYPVSYLTVNTKERVTELVERLEHDVNVDKRYKELYNLNFKYNLIDEISDIIDNNFPSHKAAKYRGLNFDADNVVLEIIRNKIYDKDKTSKYAPFNNENAIWFSTEEIRHSTYEITRILKENDTTNELINDIETYLTEVRFNIEELKTKYPNN